MLSRLSTDRLRRRSRSPAPTSGAQAERPLVVVEKVKGALLVAALDREAERLGLAAGLPLSTARAMAPALAVVEADSAADAALREALADWAERYTPFIGLDGTDGLMLDVTGSSPLFGGEVAMLADLAGRLARAGLTSRMALAGTPAAARALARFGCRDGERRIVAPGGEDEAVRPLPVAALGLDPSAATALARLGLKRIGDLALAARAPLAARFGLALLDRLDGVRGLAEEPIAPRRPLPACTAERRFAEPIGHEDDVRRSILAMAGELCAILARRGEGARRLELVFFRADGAVRRLPVEASRPLRDPQAMLRLYRERLDALADPLDPGFGFDVLRLSALVVQRLDPAQAGLDGRDNDAEALADLADRLGARLGGRRVMRLAAEDTHDPSLASRAVPVRQASAPGEEDWSAWRDAGEPPTRPLRLLDPPERVEALAEIPDGPPVRFRWRRVLHAVRKAEGPERIAPEWWRVRDDGSRAEALTRDYFRIEDESGRRFWLYREGLFGRETASPRWYLHGLFA
ncbi:MAG: DNA polymerase Y family protein [Alsobacter sp.]